jgi:sugar lactone lactonase YvrE
MSLVLSVSSEVPAHAAENSHYFSQTGKTVSGKFLEYWHNNGGLATLGYPITDARIEVSATDGQSYLTQWFERNRFELHPGQVGTPYEVQLGLLGLELKAEARNIDPDFVKAPKLFDPALPVAQQWYFEQTGHNLRFRFLQYWLTNGGLTRFGYPISEEYQELDPESNQVYLTQWFERARFEYHPLNQPAQQIQLGLLGKQMMEPQAPARLLWKLGGMSPQNMSLPVGITTDSKGAVYVADFQANKILKFDQTGQLLNFWGTTGDGPGEFNGPTGVAVDNKGNVYIADENNQRIQKFDASGQFLLEWGTPGSGEGQFGQINGRGEILGGPAGLVLDYQNNVYVADPYNFRIQKFTSNGTFLSSIGRYGRGAGEFHWPSGLALDQKNNLYVVDSVLSRIQNFDLSGKPLFSFGSQGSDDGQFSTASNRANLKIVLDNSGNIYVSDSHSFRIQKFDAQGNFLLKWGGASSNSSSASNDGKFGYPANLNGSGIPVSAPLDMAFDAQGQLYIIDPGNKRVQKFDQQGKFLAKWGETTIATSIFDQQALSVALDRWGNLYVLHNRQVQKLDSTGHLLLTWQLPEERGASFQAIAVDSLGYSYVLEPNNNSIWKFDNNGQLLLKWDLGGTPAYYGKISSAGAEPTATPLPAPTPPTGGPPVRFQPVALAIDSSDNIFVNDASGGQIKKFDSQGNFLLSIGQNTQTAFSPNGLVVDSDGNLYITDRSNKQVMKLDQRGQILLKFGSYGQNPGQFREPAGLGLDAAGNIYVYDSQNYWIQKFDNRGRFLSRWGGHKVPGQLGGGDTFNRPSLPFFNNLVVSLGGEIYLADTANGRVQKFRQQ